MSTHEQQGDELSRLIAVRLDIRPQDIACPRAKSDYTPCVARDGGCALFDNGDCVGCSEPVAALLATERSKHYGG